MLDQSTGDMSEKGIAVTVRGMGSKLSIGKIKSGEKMGSGISIEAVYYAISLDGEDVFKLDKFNNVCEINGVDIMADLKKLC